MFKNKEERFEYVKNNENWDLILNPNYVRVKKLKDCNIIKIEVYLNLDMKWFEPHWAEIGTYETDARGEIKSIYSLSLNQLVEEIKKY